MLWRCRQSRVSKSPVQNSVRLIRGKQFSFQWWFSIPKGASSGVGYAVQVGSRSESQDSQDSHDGDNETKGIETKKAKTGLNACRARIFVNLDLRKKSQGRAFGSAYGASLQ